MHLRNLRRRACRAIANVFMTVLAASAFPAAAAIPQSERDALLALYASTDGPHWRRSDGWGGPPGTECTWRGIRCDVDDLSHVTSIDLSENFLRGTLPSLIALTELRSFNIDFNIVSGSLPSLSGMRHLQVFDVGANDFSGEIPPLTDLDAIEILDFSYNEFTGTIPVLDLPTLTAIDFGGNHFTGPLPSFAHVPNLMHFQAYRNELTGTIPSLTGLPQLRLFNVAENQLTGHLPPAPAQLTPGLASVCPNPLDPDPDPEWDLLTGHTPWYIGCNGAHLNLNQVGLGGTWYNPYNSGQGFLLTAWPDLNGAGHGVVFGGWFTFTPQLDSDPTTPHWFSFQGDVDTASSEVVLDLYETHGGRFAAPPPPTTRRVGTVTLSLVDCWHGTLRYDFDDQRVDYGRIPIRRLIANANCTLNGDAPPPTDSSRLSGAWYDPSLTGQGLIVDISPEQGTLFAAWYTFRPGFTAVDPEHELQWYYMQAGDVGSDATAVSDVPIYQPPQGMFLGPQSGADTVVGHANFMFDGCDALMVTYRFNASGLVRTLNLVRLGATSVSCR
jgi:hypothetical protein